MDELNTIVMRLVFYIITKSPFLLLYFGFQDSDVDYLLYAKFLIYLRTHSTSGKRIICSFCSILYDRNDSKSWIISFGDLYGMVLVGKIRYFSFKCNILYLIGIFLHLNAIFFHLNGIYFFI